ncbi:MAG: hypothetical protein JWL85_790 [Candidatus Saccharibacteria bacterium]|nr:hypothetical protein [Candidatus Saccharibacteria bacterium]
MNARGYTIILEAVRKTDELAVVIPVPSADIHERFVTVSTKAFPGRTLNALDAAGLLAREPGNTALVITDRPQLKIVQGLSRPRSITFEDLNIPPGI